MSVPNNWIQTTLGDTEYFEPLGTGIDSFTGVKDYLSTSSVGGTRILYVEEEVSFKKRPSRANLQPVPNAVWFARMRETCKVLEANDYLCERAILSTGFCGLRSDKIVTGFLKQFVLSEAFERQKDRLAEGSTQAAMTNGKLGLIDICLPISKHEQSKIAEVLSTVDRAIEQTEALIAKQQRIKTGLMQDLLTRGIDEHGNICSEETHQFKDSPLGRIPVEWKIETLNNCVRPGAPICYGILMPGQGHDGGVPVIKVKDIISGRIVQDDILLTDPEIDAQYKRSRLRADDLLLTIRGTTGRLALVPPELDGANITQDTARVRLKEEMSSQFFYFLLQSFLLQDQIRLHTLGQAVKGINIGEVKKIFFGLPDEDEQKEIAKHLGAIQQQIDRSKREMAKQVAIKTALMQDLLTGKVRVTELLKQKTSTEKGFTS